MKLSHINIFHRILALSIEMGDGFADVFGRGILCADEFTPVLTTSIFRVHPLFGNIDSIDDAVYYCQYMGGSGGSF
jgi:hypothetical protein